MTTNSPGFALKSTGNGETSANDCSNLNVTPYYSNLNVAPETSGRKKAEWRLPPPGAMRWSVRNKAAVVTAVRSGDLTLEEACKRYSLTEPEYRSWEQGLDIYGLAGLGLAARQKFRSILSSSEK
jgi:hypothetical protein